MPERLCKMNTLIRQMQNIGDTLDKISSSFAAMTFFVMSILVIMQVISRCFFNYSFQWAEEMARYLFIWSTMLAAACAIRTQMHIGVDILVSYARGRVQLTMKLVAQVFVLAAVVSSLYMAGSRRWNHFTQARRRPRFPYPRESCICRSQSVGY